jgi:hypothetical protein
MCLLAQFYLTDVVLFHVSINLLANFHYFHLAFDFEDIEVVCIIFRDYRNVNSFFKNFEI